MPVCVVLGAGSWARGMCTVPRQWETASSDVLCAASEERVFIGKGPPCCLPIGHAD